MTSPSRDNANANAKSARSASFHASAGANTVRWTPEQIRAARIAPLLPLLQAGGIATLAREADYYLLPAYPGLIVKESYWRWPERDLAGNAIDFHTRVLGLSFHDAMRRIAGTA